MTSSSLLSSMEVMLDALMQRGIGKPDDKPKEEPPPALPTRPTVRGRPPSLNRPGAGPAPWMSSHRPPLAPIPLPPQEEEEKGKSSVHLELEICERKNLELETRALNAEEEVKQRDDDVRQKEEEIAALRQQVEHYESRVSEYELKLKSVEEELQKQTIALQVITKENYSFPSSGLLQILHTNRDTCRLHCRWLKVLGSPIAGNYRTVLYGLKRKLWPREQRTRPRPRPCP